MTYVPTPEEVEAGLYEDVTEGCSNPGSLGVHTSSYGDDGDGMCESCGARPTYLRIQLRGDRRAT